MNEKNDIDLLDIEILPRRKFLSRNEKTGDGFVYFLIENMKVVYIGKTFNSYERRLAEHSRRLNFDHYATINYGKISEIDLKKKELYWIIKCYPILNCCLTIYEKYNSKKMGIKTSQEIINWCLNNYMLSQ